MDLTRILLVVSAWNIHLTKVLIFQNSPYSGRNCLILPHYTYLMKLLLTTILIILLLCLFIGGYAQSHADPSIPQPDDEFNVFLLAITIAFFSMVIGGALIGAFAA